jgi:hypothetical protein
MCQFRTLLREQHSSFASAFSIDGRDWKSIPIWAEVQTGLHPQAQPLEIPSSLGLEGEYSHDHLARRGHRHGSSSIRLQLDQTHECYSRAAPVRTSGIRMRSALHRLHSGARSEWPESVVDRRLSLAQRARRFGLSVSHGWPARQTSDEPNTIGSIGKCFVVDRFTAVRERSSLNAKNGRTFWDGQRFGHLR